MRTILLRPTIPTTAELKDPVLTTDLGRGTFAYRPLQKRPLQRFSLRCALNDRATQEGLRELATFAGGYTPIWFDGNAWAEIAEPILVFIGNGLDNEIILPFGNVFPATCVFTEDGIVRTDWTTPDDGASGIFTFSSPIADSSELRWSGTRKIKVRIIGSRDSTYQSIERAPFQFEETIELEEIE